MGAVTITAGYATRTELQQRLGITTLTSSDEVRIDAAVEAASRAVDAHCAGYADALMFVVNSASSTTRTFYASDSRTVHVDVFTSSGSVVLKADDDDDGTAEITWTSTDYVLEPLNASVLGKPYTTIRAVESRTFPQQRRPGVSLTAVFGYGATVPAPVKEATLIKAARIYRRADTPEGIATGEAFGAIRISSREDPDVLMLLGPYRRAGGQGVVII